MLIPLSYLPFSIYFTSNSSFDFIFHKILKTIVWVFTCNSKTNFSFYHNQKSPIKGAREEIHAEHGQLFLVYLATALQPCVWAVFQLRVQLTPWLEWRGFFRASVYKRGPVLRNCCLMALSPRSCTLIFSVCDKRVKAVGKQVLQKPAPVCSRVSGSSG